MDVSLTNETMTLEHSELGLAARIAPIAQTRELPQAYYEVRWYAACTNANHEKRIADQLRVRGVENFLPVYQSRRKWKDRRVILELPLFPGYVFIHIALSEKLRVLQVPGVARFVGFDGTPAALPDKEMEGLRSGLENGIHAVPHPGLRLGQRVRIQAGPMAGLEGILQRHKGRARLVVSLDLIQRSMALEIDSGDVEAVRV